MLTEPIRAKSKINEMIKFLGRKNPRDKLLFLFGLNTGLRISDILNRRFEDFFIYKWKFREYLTLREKKVDNQILVDLSDNIVSEIERYCRDYSIDDKEYLFKKNVYGTEKYHNGVELQVRLLNEAKINTTDIMRIQSKDISDHTLVLKRKRQYKQKRIKINEELRHEILKYCKRFKLENGDYIFFTFREPYGPLDRIQAWRILKRAATACGVENFAPHSMRKSAGYHLYINSGYDIAKVMKFLNHNDPRYTMRYIGLDQDTIDKACSDISFGL